MSIVIEKRRANHAFVLALFGVFVGLVLVAFYMGVQAFSAISDTYAQADAARGALSVITNQVKSLDRTDAVRIESTNGADMLVIAEQGASGSYETRVFLHDGQIVEQYALADDAVSAEAATALQNSSTFELELEGALLTITTDAGTAHVALRCATGEGVPAVADGAFANYEAESTSGEAAGVDVAGANAREVAS